MTSTETTGYDPRQLARIRGLLAKAESTTSPAEAQALSDKAQELLAKYNIDTRVLDAEGGEDHSSDADKLIVVGDGYARQLTALVCAIGKALGCYVVRTWSPEAERKVYDIFETTPQRDAVHVFGTEASIELIELLYVSLALQMTSARNALTIEDVPASIRRTTRGQAAALRKFRTSWSWGWIAGVGDRLRAAHGRAVAEAESNGKGAELVLVTDVKRFEATAKTKVHGLKKSGKYTYNIEAEGAGRTASEKADIGLSRVGGKRAIGG